MAEENKSDNSSSDPIVLIVKRRFDARPEQVFDAWLDRDSIQNWLFATPGGEMVRVEVDPCVGGEFLVFEKRGDMVAEHYGRYVEIDRPRRIVFLFAVEKFTEPTDDVSRVAIDIAAIGSGCEVTLTHEINPKWAEYVDRTRGGWTKILEKLNTMLATKGKSMTQIQDFGDTKGIVSTRVIDAPRELVFRAFSDPQQLAVWWGPNGFTNTVEKFDLRVDGEWHLTMHGPDGTDYPNESVFLEVAEPQRIVYLHLRPMHRFQMSMDYVDRGEQTELTWRMLFDSDEECERVRQYVVPANEQNFDRLAAHLKTISK